jgi:hypothetical protein
MKTNQTISIQLTNAEDQPLAVGDVLVEIHFFTKGLARYAFKAGRTNELGTLNISYVDIEKLRLQNASFFLMDYNTRLEECDSKIRITIPSERELQSAFEESKRLFGESPAWARVWPANARIESISREIDLIGTITGLKLFCKQL